VPANFTFDDLARVAQLARIELTADEQRLFARQLSEFLASAELLQDVDTDGVPPTSHPTGASGAALRDDVTRPSLPREAALAQAPDLDTQAGLFKVPRVLG
jgi:aspartyl-tRNA(Asn)/glutamyl-tRNA(Gln) amidotransferase subunit C